MSKENEEYKKGYRDGFKDGFEAAKQNQYTPLSPIPGQYIPPNPIPSYQSNLCSVCGKIPYASPCLSYNCPNKYTITC